MGRTHSPPPLLELRPPPTLRFDRRRRSRLRASQEPVLRTGLGDRISRRFPI